jgi:ornithine cyclodeaminase/alanine dehydrogenase-like protein (mu-crystallin family)
MVCVLALNAADVERLLDLDELVEAVASGLASLSSGSASMPARTGVRGDGDGYLAVMPAHVPELGALTTKLVTLFPSNAGSPLPTHQAVILAFDPGTGTPVALMDGTLITASRTAAASALATRLLAQKDASVLAVLGTGVQARSHLRALPRVRPFSEVRVAGRNRSSAQALADIAVREDGTTAIAVGSYREAVQGADVVCACTHSPTPVVERAWLSDRAHINAVGLNPGGSEVDADTIRDAAVVVESRASSLQPFPAGAGELADAVAHGWLDPSTVLELGEIVSRIRPVPHAGLTLYRSVGVAVEDAAAAALVLDAARREAVGSRIEL